MPVAGDVFDRFPHGIVVCDPGGRVVAANPRVRLDLSTLGADGLRVATAPLHDHGSHVVLELCEGGDRRRPGGSLRVFALGDLRVEGPNGPLSGAWLDQRAGQLLRFLVCRRGRVTPADVIAEALWPHAGSTGTNTLRHFVHALRERLEPERPRHATSAFIECRRGGYTLRADRVWIDAEAFERDVRRGMAALAVGQRAEAARRLERAVALYREDFLSDEPYADWAFAERERLRAIAHNAFRGLAELHADRPAVAAMYLERLAELEPFDDDVHRELIAAWLRLGRKSRAARYYESFRVRLLREFGARPDFDLHQIACAAPAVRSA